MDKTQALDAFAALSQETRLDVFRLLVQHGAAGLPAGEIAERLGVRQNTMSANLAILARADLVRGVRDGRIVRYSADFDGMRGLLAFLMQDCCGGQPALCQPVLDAITCAC